MDIVDVGSKVIANLKAEQAVLEILDYKKSEKNHFKKPEKEPSVQDKAANALKGLVKGKKKESSSSTETATKITQKIKAYNMSKGKLTVQYNPSSLKYEASTSETENKKEEGGKQVVNISNICTTKVSFDLVFHSELKGDTSVRDQMDFIMNMLYETPNKSVKFSWAKLQIEGQVVSFSGEYDMFDSTGNPISGKMSISIQSKMPIGEVRKIADKIDSNQSVTPMNSKEPNENGEPDRQQIDKQEET